MNHTLLIEELTHSQANLISEASTDGKDCWLSGIYMMGGVGNRNGRNYPVNEISMAVESANTRIKETGGLFGELDHPTTLTINLDRISHVITEMKMEGNNAIGKAKLLPTPMGEIAKALVQSGVALGVSSRGAGAVNESGGVTGFQFVTVDIVAQPSAPSAYPAAVYESLQQAQNGHNIMDLAESVRHDPSAQKFLQKELMSWLSTGLFAKRK